MVVPVQPFLLAGWAPFQALSGAFAKGDPCLRVDGLWGSSRALVVSALLRDAERSALVLVSDRPALDRTGRDLRFFEAALEAPARRVAEFPPGQPAFWRGRPQREEAAERAWVCHRLLRGDPLTVVTIPAALTSALPPPEEFRRLTFSLAVGASVAREELLKRLEAAGYERVETVVEVGQWSVRGGIVDLFSPVRERPARVEFFGDEVESLRLFDPTSQRSLETLESLEVLPLSEREGGEATFLTYLGAGVPVILDGPALLEGPRDDAPSAIPLGELLAGRQRVELGLLPVAAPASLAGRFTLETGSVGSFRGQFRPLAAELATWLREGFRVRLVVQDEAQARRLKQILLEHGLEAAPAASLGGPEGLVVLVGDCAQGFSIPALGLIVLTEEELFGARRRTLRRPRFQRGAALTAFTDLEVGNLVVHEEHGIGRYLGLKTIPVDDRQGDFLLLEYAEGNRLYLPIERLSVISKYLGGDGQAARLDRLGGASWQRVKESVRTALRQMAEELLRLYAARSVLDGHLFGPDAPWQREFEAAFRFEETPDQLRAIEEVKADMEKPGPMDRLVAGDVGYGKTEVALRAAFKAAMDGKQVALLAPTTILAQQHWATFTERFAPFPLRVELLSRFRSPKEQKAVVAGLRQGTVDVVIGTHRLLSRDVAFRDLGLLIVDEEHRFGVAHKARIKQLRKSVDVLTLTIETVVAPFSRQLIREALERELARGGQVFFVHNRVQSLPSMTAFIQRLVPRARVLMAHGQMREKDLEDVMLRFVGGHADILVSTAIVESGLDIPASNTIVVNRADRFGLAQLYQLRGRVGRERQQAYAYLLTAADGRVDDTAQKRLRVIQELTELGSGFRLALRDLEIRGAGNLLGAQQHGHIAAVGFDLYSKLLAEAVRELTGETVEEAPEPVVTVEVEALLPESYVPDVSQRLALYKRLAGLTRAEEVAEIHAELRDRFGPLPPPVVHLLEIVELRAAARALGIERLEAVGGRAVVTFAPSTPVAPERLVRAVSTEPGRLRLRKEFVVEAPIPRGPWPAVRQALGELLGSLG
ncbi:MAG: transcription-repair coupling factor [Candidatus Rokubacteria bacterium]|nr:transcription-repair coupling factor [Candidatus Rokubacteria bacterium]